MKEACLVLCGDSIVHLSLGTATKIPDSAERWERIWNHRDSLTEIAHTHPGGSLRFSDEDLTTMQAVEAALGQPIAWSIVTEGGFVTRRGGEERHREDTPWWLPVLREISFDRAQGPADPTRKGEHHARTD